MECGECVAYQIAEEGKRFGAPNGDHGTRRDATGEFALGLGCECFSGNGAAEVGGGLDLVEKRDASVYTGRCWTLTSRRALEKFEKGASGLYSDQQRLSHTVVEVALRKEECRSLQLAQDFVRLEYV